MDWFELIGLFLGFVGSVLFSAGLIKTPEQIRDENQTYFDKNFFTYESEMASRRMLVVAFLLIIAGFAVSVGGAIAAQFHQDQQLVGILLSITLTAVGFLATALFYIQRVNAHRRLKYEYAKRMFRNTVQTYLDKWDTTEKANFNEEKRAIETSLTERLSRLDPEDNETSSRLLSRSATAKDLSSLKELFREYLDVTN